MRQRSFLILLFGALITAIAAAQRTGINPAASPQSILYLVGDSERELTRLPARFTRLSDADEIAAGDATARIYLSTLPKLTTEDAVMQSYVQRVGQRVAGRAERKLSYRFEYVPDRDFVNAFALPGGHVFIGAGLIERMETEDELAAVLGHEIEHIDHYHCAERLQVENALRKVRAPFAVALPIAVFQAGYSKNEEMEADAEGTRLAVRAGYSARGALRLFETFDRLSHVVLAPDRSPQDELTRVASNVLTGYFRSHPPTAERIARLKTAIAQDPALTAAAERQLEVHHIVLARRSFDAIEKENFNDAAALASRALRLDPGYSAALLALTEADFGRESLAAAQAEYRALREIDSAAASTGEDWLLARAQHLIEANDPHRAATVLAAFLDVQKDDPRILRVLAFAQALDGDIESASSSAHALRRLYPDIARTSAREMEPKAADLLKRKRFRPAASVAGVCLILQEPSLVSLRTLAEAEFAQANFEEAARAYELALAAQPDDVEMLHSFSDALASARPATAVRDLQSVAPRLKVPEASLRTELAGLALLTGNDALAHETRQAVQRREAAPEMLARLGWWYFRARRMEDAKAVLDEALAQRPSNAEIQNNLAWTELELTNSNPSFVAATTAPDRVIRNSAAARQAIEVWREGRKVDAIDAWVKLTRENPEWRNEKWRAAIYPKRIVEAAGQLENERLRQDETKRTRFRESLVAIRTR